MPTQILAERLHVSPRTLERWRVEGTGPPYMKAGGRVLYHEEDVISWLRASQRRSTSEQPTPVRTEH